MVLLTRLSRLLLADLHGVLDLLEEPELLLRQAIREMEEVLAEDERLLERMQRELNQCHLRQQPLSKGLSSVDGELDLCLTKEDEAHARSLVRKKLELERQTGFLADKAAELESRILDLTSTVARRRSELEGVRQKADLLVEGGSSGEGADAWAAPDLSVTGSDVEIALLHEKQRRYPS